MQDAPGAVDREGSQHSQDSLETSATALKFSGVAEVAGAAMIDPENWPQATDRARWQELLRVLNPEALTDQFMLAVRTVPGYEEPIVAPAEIRRTAVISFEALIDTLKTGDSTALHAIAFEIGSTRARAGVPLTALMNAIRLDFELLWNRLVKVSAPDDSMLLLRHAMYLWRVVDSYVRATQTAFLDEQRLQTDRAMATRRALIAELFQSPPPAPSRLATIGAELGVPETAHLVVTVAGGAAIPTLSTITSRAQQAGVPVVSHFRDTCLVALIDLSAASPKVATDHLDALHTVEGGLVDAVPGLAEVPGAVDLAVALADIAVPGFGRAATPERDWARLLRHHLQVRQPGIVRGPEELLAECGLVERQNVESAVRAYLETGNIAAAAAATFCHRNTLTNRLRRFAELTGIDVTVPQQAARIVIAWA